MTTDEHLASGWPEPWTPSGRTGGKLAEVVPLPADLVALLGPRLDERPACAGQAPAWDEHVAGESPIEREERLLYAVESCASCAALPECSAALVDLDRSAGGVWAGQLRTARGRDGHTTRGPRT